jgi:S1-C subfamily serine protease
VVHEDGWHRWTARYNDRDKVTEFANFGVDGKPTLHKTGYHKRAHRYDDRGKELEISYFGVNGQPGNLKAGYARLTRIYNDKGQRIDEVASDAAGKPVPLQTVIDKIDSDGHAERLGLRPGDLFLAYRGQPVTSPSRFEYERANEPPDLPPAELKVLREEKTVTVRVSPGVLGVTLRARAAARAEK